MSTSSVRFGDFSQRRTYAPIPYLESLVSVAGEFESLETIVLRNTVCQISDNPLGNRATLKVSDWEVSVTWTKAELGSFLTVTETLQKMREPMLDTEERNEVDG